jgi:FYVE zinc finger
MRQGFGHCRLLGPGLPALLVVQWTDCTCEQAASVAVILAQSCATASARHCHAICRPNADLRLLVTSAAFNAGGGEDDGWERVPTRANAIRMYAHELAGNLADPSAPTPAATQAVTTSGHYGQSTVQHTEDSRPVEQSTQIVVREAAQRCSLSPRGEPLSIVMNSYHTARSGEPRYSYESILSWVPPQWLPDSCATVCKGCSQPFKPVVRLRHHCRLCGQVFCHQCSQHKVLLPPKCAASLVLRLRCLVEAVNIVCLVNRQCL